MGRPCTFKANFVIAMGITYDVEWGRESEAADRDSAAFFKLKIYFNFVFGVKHNVIKVGTNK